MIYNAKEYARLRNAVLLISLIAWIIIMLAPRNTSCCSPSGFALSWASSFRSGTAVSFAFGWALMLIAMMTPMLVPPLYHIRITSFRRRRAWATVLFVAGYGLIWMAAGSGALIAELTASRFMHQSFLPAILVAVAALVWQVSPYKQTCLNRCHQHGPLAAFGTAADLDALCMGLKHGRWCTGSCWATMLFPMLLPEGHVVAMAAVSTLMFCERLDPPRIPSWGWRGFGAASRYIRFWLRRSTPNLVLLTSAAQA
jgi:predicted metal-binding membrane protein